MFIDNDQYPGEEEIVEMPVNVSKVGSDILIVTNYKFDDDALLSVDYNLGAGIVYNKNDVIDTGTKVELLSINDASTGEYYGYCVDFETELDKQVKYKTATCEEIVSLFPLEYIKNLRKIVNISYPFIKDLTHIEEEAKINNIKVSEVVAATQAAIWSLVNDFEMGRAEIEKTYSQNTVDLYNYFKINSNPGWDLNDVVKIGDNIKLEITCDNTAVEIGGLNIVDKPYKFGPLELKSNSYLTKDIEFSLKEEKLNIKFYDKENNEITKVKIDTPFFIYLSDENISELKIKTSANVVYGADVAIISSEGKKSQTLMAIINLCKEFSAICNLYVSNSALNKKEKGIIEIKNEIIEIEKGIVEIIKVDGCCEAMGLGGAIFEIRNCENKVIDTIETKKDGCGLSKEIPYGNYILYEIKPPNGHTLNSEPIFIKINSYKNTIKISNDKVPYMPKGRFKIFNNKLNGAIFEIFDLKGDVVDTITTEKDEYAFSKYLPYGTYLIIEKKAPEGYKLNFDKISVEINSSNYIKTIDIPNIKVEKKPKGEFLLLTMDNICPCNKLEGIEFKLYDIYGNHIKTIITDENGKANSERIAFGKYKIIMTEVKEGYKVKQMPIFIQIDSEDFISVFEIPLERE